MEISSAFDEAEKVREKVIAGATDPKNLFGVSFLNFKGSMYPKKIPVTSKKRQHGIAYLRVNFHLNGKLHNARVEQDPLYTNFCLNLSQSKYYKGSDTFVSLLELNRKHKHQYLCSNAKIWLLFNDGYDDVRMDNVKR